MARLADGSTALMRSRGSSRIFVSNVALQKGAQTDMHAVYSEHDFTLVRYTTADGGKECRRSLVETLACGVPNLISHVAPPPSFVQTSFMTSLESALSRYESLSKYAAERALAHFDLRSTVTAYSEIYDSLR